MILLIQLLLDLSLIPRIKSSMISMVALSTQPSALKLKLQVSNGALQMLLMLIMLHTPRLLSWIRLLTRFMMHGDYWVFSLSTSITQRIISHKSKYRLWVWLLSPALTTTSLAWLIKLSAQYSWSMSKMVIISMFIRNNSELQMSRLFLKLLDLWFKITSWAASLRPKTPNHGFMVLHHLSLILCRKETSTVEM